MIELNEISHFYGQTKVLGPLSFTFEKAKQYALVGESGSGKSTLLNLVGLMLTPSQGQIKIADKSFQKTDDQSLSHMRLRTIGFVHQFFDLINDLSVVENIEVPLWLTKDKNARRKAEELLERVGLSDHTDKLVTQLSGGQQQRVAIARAIALKPLVILADEPTGSLDSKTGHQVMELLKRVAEQQGSTLIVATHSQAIRDQLDVCVAIEDGQIIEQPHA